MKLLLQTIFLLILFAFNRAQANTCVLSLFEKNSEFEKIVTSVYGFDSKMTIYRQAQLKDIDSCFSSGEYDEIIFVGHGSSTQRGLADYSAPFVVLNDNSKFPLTKTFFRKVEQNARFNFIKKVRISLCGLDFSQHSYVTNSDNHPQFSSMDDFIRTLYRQNITVDISPRFDFGSWLLKENVTRLTMPWLAKSIDRERLTVWRTEANRYCKFDWWPRCDRQEAEWTAPIARMKN